MGYSVEVLFQCEQHLLHSNYTWLLIMWLDWNCIIRDDWIKKTCILNIWFKNSRPTKWGFLAIYWTWEKTSLIQKSGNTSPVMDLEFDPVSMKFGSFQSHWHNDINLSRRNTAFKMKKKYDVIAIFIKLAWKKAKYVFFVHMSFWINKVSMQICQNSKSNPRTIRLKSSSTLWLKLTFFLFA